MGKEKDIDSEDWVLIETYWRVDRVDAQGRVIKSTRALHRPTSTTKPTQAHIKGAINIGRCMIYGGDIRQCLQAEDKITCLHYKSCPHVNHSL